jgi:hypothetical protein
MSRNMEDLGHQFQFVPSQQRLLTFRLGRRPRQLRSVTTHRYLVATVHTHEYLTVI